MVEQRPLGSIVSHLVLIAGVAVVALPLYVGFVASTLSFDQVTAYYLYLDTPISFGVFGADVTVGKFGQQFTPYTLKLIDVDSYTYNDKTDSGNYPILGGRINFKVGGINVQYYAGKHDLIPYAPLTSTAGVSNAVTGSDSRPI